MSQTYSEYTTNMRLLESYKDKAIGRECEWYEKRITTEIGEVTNIFSFYCVYYTFTISINGYFTNISITERTEDNPMGKNEQGIKSVGMSLYNAKKKDLSKFAKIFFSYVPLASI